MHHDLDRLTPGELLIATLLVLFLLGLCYEVVRAVVSFIAQIK